MKRHWNYLKYLLRHKYFVYLAGRRLNISRTRLILHDLSKFLPSEWGPYSRTFFDRDGNSRYREHPDFKKAWLYHQRRNPHHWQYWRLLQDTTRDMISLMMPLKYRKEMVADWAGAGRALNGIWDLQEWYDDNKDRMILHPSTREEVAVDLKRLRGLTETETGR